MKKILSLVLIMLIAVCGGIFVGCGQDNKADNISLRISSGLDSSLSESSLNALSTELKLSEGEKNALSTGTGYNNVVATKDAVTLVLGNENYASRQITVEIVGWEEGMGRNVYFSTDSSIIGISEVEYLTNGKAKATITASSAGTATVTARSGQYSKTTSFTVKVVEKLSGFSVKNNAVIYLEKNSVLTINPSNYIDFYPSTATMTEVEFYDNSVLLTQNGVTKLSTVAVPEDATVKVIDRNTTLTIRSTRIDGTNSVQTISLIIVDEISQLDMKKLTYTEETGVIYSTYSDMVNNSVLTVVRNSEKTVGANTVDYGLREVYVIVKNNESALNITATPYIDGEIIPGLSIISLGSEKITEDTDVDGSQYINVVREYIEGLEEEEKYSFWVFKFGFQYEGYSAYDVKFTFNVGNYEYSNEIGMSVEFKNGSDLIEFKVSTETSERLNNTYTIYDWYNGVYGTRFSTKTNTGDMPYTLGLFINSSADTKLQFKTTTGQTKAKDSLDGDIYSSYIPLANGENIYISGTLASEETYKVYAEVSYICDGVKFTTGKEITLVVESAPTILEFHEADSEPTQSNHSNVSIYNLDLNISGKRIGENDTFIPYNAKNTISLYVFGFSEEIPIGNVEDFKIISKSDLISVEKDEINGHKINITALKTGTTTFTIISGNNVSATFTIEVVNSVSQLNITIPNENQNDNVFNLRTDYLHTDTKVYRYNLTALTNKNIPIMITKSGVINSLNMVGTNLTYTNGYIKATQNFENQIINVSISYYYIDGNGIKQSADVIATCFLMSSMTEVQSLNLTTSKNSTDFTLYDYSSVGYYSRELSTINTYINILPLELASSLLKDIVWQSNRELTCVSTDNVDTYTCDVFTFTYYKQQVGDNVAGSGVIVCNVTNPELYDGNGNFIGGKIVLTASLDRGAYGQYSRSLQFNIVKNLKVELIATNTSKIKLDAYTNEFDLIVTTYPLQATNANLLYTFIPTVNGGLSTSDISVVVNENGAKIILENTNVAGGSGILRIVATDSYTSSNTYTTVIEIPIEVAAGTEESPYYISSTADMQKMIKTDFSKVYKISGEINIANWEYGKYTLSGKIIGENNAKLIAEIRDYSQSENEYYFGLFKEITGSIENIAVDVTFNVDLQSMPSSRTAYIGGLSAINSGTIKNVYVEVNGGEIKIANGYSIYFGAMVAINTGDITQIIGNVNYDYTRLVKFEKDLIIKDTTSSNAEFVGATGYYTEKHVLFIGGVVGSNSGIVSRRFSGNTESMFNNAYTTADVLLKLQYSNTQTNFSSTRENEGIGAIAGRSTAGEIYGVITCGTITAGILSSNSFEGHFDNIGGIVGYNQGDVGKTEKCTSQTFVRGKCNVGGAVGFNKGNTNISVLVESLDDGNKKEFNTTLIIGQDNVGGIVGYLAAGRLTNSSFISYLTRTYMEGINNSLTTREYFGDLIAFDKTGTSSAKYGLIIGQQGNGAIIDYVVAIARGRIINGSQSMQSISSANYAIYNAAYNVNIVPNVRSNNLADKTPIELREYAGFEFIFLPPTTIGLELTTNATDNNKMSTEDNNDPLAFYLFYYESTDTNIQKNIIDANLVNHYAVSDFLTNNGLTGQYELKVNSDILKINNNGEFIVSGTGLAELTVTTLYNLTLSQTIYVYIVNYVNNISLYTDEAKSNEVESENFGIDATDSTAIYISLFDKYNIDKMVIPETVNIEFIVSYNGAQYVIRPGEGKIAGIEFTLTKVDSETYQIVVYGNIAEYIDVTIKPYIQFTQNNKIYTNDTLELSDTLADDRIANIQTHSSITINTFVLKNTTKNIRVSKNTIITEPYYETSVDVFLDSKNQDETLSINVTLIDSITHEDMGSYHVGMLNITAFYNETRITNNGLSSFNIENINCGTLTQLKVYFKIGNDYKNFNTPVSFKIEFKSSNGKITNVILTFEPQEVINIATMLYPLISENDTIYDFGDQQFSYIPTGVIIPGQNSLIDFTIIPSFTSYSYIEIRNAAGNQYNLLFDVFNRTDNTVVTGATILSNGISIPASITTNGSFSLRTFLDQDTADGSNVSLIITLKDENGNIIGESITKTFYVEQLPGVRVTVDGVASGNSTSVKLARGVTYDLGVWVKGYNSSTLVKNGNTYTDGELIFVVNSNLITIVKDEAGEYQIVVTGLPLPENREVKITTYGQKTTQNGTEKSKEAELLIEIVQFVVKPTQTQDIIAGVFNGVYASAIGNVYTFNVTLNSNVLIYDQANAEITAMVERFLTSLSTGVLSAEVATNVWYYQDQSKALNSWAVVVADNLDFKTIDGASTKKVFNTANGVFTFTYDTASQVFNVRFLKIEYPTSPTYKFKYVANYYYNDGVPTLFVNETATATTEAKYSLTSEFVFDIAEKTDIRNPYPIYTYAEFINMREGNYYILMNDIVLEENFEPITTQIGGLDGNNYKIIIPKIDRIATETNESVNFGIFARTGEETLLKNIIIYINESVEISFYNYGLVTYGLLVANNYGQITNCSIQGSQYAIVNLNLFGVSSSNVVENNVGALVGINYGEISNSRVEVGIAVNLQTVQTASYMPANLGGIAAVNKGDATIVSSYIKARIENHTAGSLVAITGGIVAINELGATICMTYIEGEFATTNSRFADGINNIVFTTANGAAFVYENNGEVLNCYANIPVVATGASSGFVFINRDSGKIEYCFSVSKIESAAKNGAFIGIKTGVTVGSILNTGSLKECFALTEIEDRYYATEAFDEYAIGDLVDPGDNNETTVKAEYNYGLGSNEGVVGLKTISAYKFEKSVAQFEKYAFSATAKKTDGVWFYGSGSIGEAGFERNGTTMAFRSGYPQLVSANIIAVGTQELLYSEYDNVTGITQYVYGDVDSNHGLGTEFNPYVIANGDDLEFLATQNANGFIIGECYVRLICDIIYKDSTVSSGLYKYSFLGNLEGNGFTIGNYVLDSSDNVNSAGFFATIGTPSNHGGSIKNAVFAPKYISVTNANAVGAVAGILYGSTLVNIKIDGYMYSPTNNGIVILGKNAVGGLIGIAEGQYSINEIDSNISVNSTYRAKLNGHSEKNYQSDPLNVVSYSGLIAGIVNGRGKLTYIYVYGENVSVAENAGLMFGYVGKNVVAQNLSAIGALKQSIKADLYGGIIAAQNQGTLKDIIITGLDAVQSFFTTEDFIPVALGNIVGYMTNGLIETAVVTTKLKAQTGVSYLGGAVGLMKAGTIKNVLISGDITGGGVIGGIVGEINVSLGSHVNIEDNFYNGKITSNSSASLVTIGSVVGFVVNVGANSIATDRTGQVNIIANTDFITNIKGKITDGTYKNTTVSITTYSYAENIEIWYNAVIQKSTSGNQAVAFILNGENINDIYGISETGNSVYVPLANSYKENGN